jgi:hypothetical protein
MGYQTVFKRYEMKYLLSREQYDIVRDRMGQYMKGDEFGRSTICNIYFDTPSHLLIRRSIEKPLYKEKLRLRSYGVASSESNVFVEIKKKYQSVVYKRRISMEYEKAVDYLLHGEKVMDSQISHEIDFFLERYENLQPAVFLSYEREAFYANDDHEFRVTFDENILWRDYDISLTKGVYGSPILENGQVLMEIKTGSAIPLWMTELLSELHVYKTSFSKYGNAYKSIVSNGQEYCKNAG